MLRLAVVVALAVSAGGGFALLWLASYGWDLEDLVEREVQGYRAEDINVGSTHAICRCL